MTDTTEPTEGRNLLPGEWGTKRFGDLQEGDLIEGMNGPVQVMSVYEEHVPASMYRVEFDNGAVIDASGNHLWYVESSFDRKLHKERLKEAKQLLASVNETRIATLTKMAEFSEDQAAPITLSEMGHLVFGSVDERQHRLLVRVARSIGHVAEINTLFQDMYEGEIEPELTTTVREYDSRLFAQQVLALRDSKMAERWPVVKGQVLTTEEILDQQDAGLEFPDSGESVGQLSMIDRIVRKVRRS